MDCSNAAIRIVVIDNEVAQHEALRVDLEKYYNDKKKVLVGVYHTVESAFAGSSYTHLSCVVINSSMVDFIDNLIINLKNTRGLPIIVLHDVNSALTPLGLMKIGADSVLSKPYELVEYLYNVRNLLNLYYTVPDQSNLDSKYKKLSLRSAQREILINGIAINLTTKEYEVLHYLTNNAGRFLTPTQIFQNVWNEEAQTLCDAKSVRDIICRLRKKLKKASDVVCIESKYAYGYRLYSEK